MERSPATELAARLRRVWDLSGRSLRALATDAALSSSSLSRYVAGRTVPPWEAVVALCRVVKRDPRPLRPLWEEARRSASTVAPPQRPAARSPRNDLPSDVTDFTGRAGEVERVLRHVAESKAVVVDGMAGVGKTSLAVHAAHRLAREFPGGRLYIDLHGFTPGFEPVDPAEALRTLLIALDVSTRAIPDGIERLAARWRDELARRRVLCVLDNAEDADQVRPLLPGAGDSAVIVTSRRRFVALAHIPPVSLDILDGDTAKDLFRRAGGPDARYEREPEAVAEVVRLCGNLPLAIRVAAARLRHRPGWTLAVLTDRLRRQTDDFDTACGMSLRQTDPLHRKVFRRLALIPGADFDSAVAAAAVGLSVDDTTEILEDLVDIHLLDEPDADRFHMHDLVRGFAARTVEAEESGTERRRVEQRVLDHQLARAEAAFRLFPWLTLPGPVEEGPFADRDAALAWYDREHANVLATFRRAEAIGDDTFVARVPGLLRPYFGRRGGWGEEVRVLESATAAARRLGDTRLLAEVRLGLGNARYAAGNTTEALREYADAAELLADGRHQDVAAILDLRRGYLHDNLGDPVTARAFLDRSAELFKQAGDQPGGLAFALAFAAWTCYQDGDLAESARLAEESMAVFDHGLAYRTALVTYGAAIAPTEPARSLEFLRRAYALAEADDHPYDVAWALNYLAVALRYAGRHDEAMESHREAMALLEELNEQQTAVHFLNDFGATCRAAGLADEALELHRRALELAVEMRFGRQEELARRGIEAAQAMAA
ncbi:ATP-binding protein [Phytomonospora endophytica]|uniref:Tetratricopeptide (TPR) repeat protein n=1 Tax=Phytomonospora endophytica TaxID=714109 RepID=A0A841FNU1_9ACTN|nr:NB-ARC domain-containing protein [Phytomonospora endophytica]MBB6037765.1 tetratricopeptide (TPR) repeat protein [Phytomonospora endophytica]GIG67705.1 hypothetical protein Pen01_40000 [Phytomonospora endophytica]